jgi:2-succinyl-6-hydroxy-2,4-cyclohexadiene-1-carboxylate synthase
VSILTLSHTLLNSTVAALRVQTRASDGDVICLHGFTQNRFAMVNALVGPLAPHYRRIWFIDCPGHGATPVTDDDPMNFFAALDAIGAQATESAKLDLIGYSMGARLGLWFISRYPERIRRAVVASAHLGYQDEDARAARIASDDALATRLEGIPYTGGLGVDNHEFVAFLQEWNQAPLFGQRALSETDLRLRLGNHPARLGAALRSYGTGQQPDLTADLARTTTQLLYLYGEQDTAYAQMADRARHLPSCEVHMIADAAHDVLHDQPIEVGTIIASYLA